MDWLSLGRIAELGWGLEVFVVVTATLVFIKNIRQTPSEDSKCMG